jgi:tetratricopeptide (TPR) repeat protein
MKRPAGADRKHLEAAEAWLHLGNHVEAEKELESIGADLSADPEVLSVRWEICAAAKRWDAGFEVASALVATNPKRSKNWLRKSQSLKELKRIKEARVNIRLARESNDWPVDDLYELACEAAHLEDLEEALACVTAATGKPGFDRLKALALVTEVFEKIQPQIQVL